MSDDTYKTPAEIEQLTGKTPPVGAEYLPPPGKIATKEQISDFWMARGGWDETKKEAFLKKHANLETTDPEQDKRERQTQTDYMRSEIRKDIAKEMSADDIIKRYEDLGLSVRAQEFRTEHQRQEKSGDQKATDAFLIKSGSALLEIEERTGRRPETKPENTKPQTLKEIMAEAIKEVDQDKQQAIDKGLSPFRAAANEVGGQSR